jgi:hypothetical protein
MKLELKHLAAYLASDVKVNLTRRLFERNNIPLIGLTIAFNINTKEHWIMKSDVTYALFDVKLILHPLSDLAKEIEINGEKFIPIAELLKLDNPQWLERHPDNSEIEYSQNEVLANAMFSFQATLSIHLHLKHLENERSWKIEKLKEWHFDIYGLIDAGLAVDINTVKF